MRPDPPVDQATDVTTAIQEIRSNGTMYRCRQQPKQVTDCHEVLPGVPDQQVRVPPQEVDLTGVANGTDYFLVSTVNAERVFLEQNYTNNTAWVRFTLSQESNGNRKVAVTGNSPCGTPGLCGANSANR